MGAQVAATFCSKRVAVQSTALCTLKNRYRPAREVRFADAGSLTQSDYVRFNGDVFWTAHSWVRSLLDSLSVYGTVRAAPEIGTLAATSWYLVLTQNGLGSWLQVENEPQVAPANPNTPRPWA